MLCCSIARQSARMRTHSSNSNSNSTPVNSYKPYLIRALHEWITDNGMTPHLLVDATVDGVVVPATAINEGRVVLNVAYRAVMGFRVDDEYVSFSARFNGVSQEVWVPIKAVMAIYARENGQGMAIPDDPYDATMDAELTMGEQAIEEVVKESKPTLSSVPSDDDSTPPDDTPPTSPKKGGHLRVVK